MVYLRADYPPLVACIAGLATLAPAHITKQLMNPSDPYPQDRDTQWIVSAPEEAPRAVSGDLVMAWARDQATGEPRYIGELTTKQSGRNCGCECLSCGLPLTAVNAGKDEFIRRPHFRHPEGAEKGSCSILTARAVALTALKILIGPGEVFELPCRRLPYHVAGLSGQYHSAWVQAPAERVRVRSIDFDDRARGILTLDDGRQLQIEITGSLGANPVLGGGSLTPTIRLTVDDPEIAAMSPAEIRKRLKLLVDEATWCSHWNDGALASAGETAAQDVARAALDWLDDGEDLHEGLSPESRRETLLHLKAKEILEREGRICFPDLNVDGMAGLPGREPLRERVSRPGVSVRLESVVLEKHLGPIRPDVLARTVATDDWPADRLLIEVTVTNAISTERLERIRRMNFPAIEVDISRMGGQVTEAEFTQLIVEEKAGKRWLHHPDMVILKAALDRKLAVAVAENERKQVQNAEIAQRESITRKARDSRRESFEKLSVIELGRRYLESIQQYLELCSLCENGPAVPRAPAEAALADIKHFAEGLAVHGYLATEDDFLWRAGSPLQWLLSIKHDTAIGCQIGTAWPAISAIMDDQKQQDSWHPVYVLAVKTYKPTMSDEQRAKFNALRERTRARFGAGEPPFQRDRRFDKLVALLFPEMSHRGRLIEID